MRTVTSNDSTYAAANLVVFADPAAEVPVTVAIQVSNRYADGQPMLLTWPLLMTLRAARALRANIDAAVEAVEAGTPWASSGAHDRAGHAA